MLCVAKPLRCFLAAALLCGTAELSHAQDITDDLRLNTQFADFEDVSPSPLRPSSRITIGDDEIVQPKRKISVIDPYAAQGVRSGAFLLYPSLELGGVISSNVRNTSTNTKSDVGWRVKPQLRFESDWVRHSLTGSASFAAEQFVDNSDIKALAGTAESALRFEIRRTTHADLDWNYSATSTGLESNELPATATGSRLDQVLAANASVTHDFGGVEGRLRLGVSHSIYGDVELTGGGKEDNSDRNYTQLSISARAALKTGAILQPFGEVTYEPRFHSKELDRNGEQRDSQGLRLTAGVTFDDDPIWTGDVAATLEVRDYSENSFETAILPGIVANFTWRPTDLTRFEFNAGASLEDIIAAGVSSTKNWTVGVKSTHAMRDNIDLVAGLRREFKRSQGETDFTTIGSLGVNWTVNPFVVLNTGYEGTFFSGVIVNDYVDHRLLASIILRR